MGERARYEYQTLSYLKTHVFHRIGPRSSCSWIRSYCRFELFCCCRWPPWKEVFHLLWPVLDFRLQTINLINVPQTCLPYASTTASPISNIFDSHLTALNYRIGMDWNLGFMPYNSDWKEGRRLIHEHLNVKAAREYHPRIISEAQEVCRRLLDNPEKFMDHLRQ
jgi:hypothetical protein